MLSSLHDVKHASPVGKQAPWRIRLPSGLRITVAPPRATGVPSQRGVFRRRCASTASAGGQKGILRCSFTRAHTNIQTRKLAADIGRCMRPCSISCMRGSSQSMDRRGRSHYCDFGAGRGSVAEECSAVDWPFHPASPTCAACRQPARCPQLTEDGGLTVARGGSQVS